MSLILKSRLEVDYLFFLKHSPKLLDLSDWVDLIFYRVETELGVVVTSLQSPDWYEENAEEWKMKKLIIELRKVENLHIFYLFNIKEATTHIIKIYT